MSAPPLQREFQLFHAINDGGASAEVRGRIAERGLLERFRFRNVYYPAVQADLARFGGTRTPALWDGERLVEGRDAVLAIVDAM